VSGNRHAPKNYAETARILDESGLDALVTQSHVLSFGGHGKEGGKVVVEADIKGGKAEIRTRHGGAGIASHVGLVMSHDGTAATRILPSTFCIVCKNTLAAALRSDVWEFSVKNTANAGAKVRDYAETVAKSLRAFHAQTAKLQAMADRRITEAEAVSLWEDVLRTTEGKATRGKAGEVIIAGASIVDSILGETETRGSGGKLVQSLLEAYESAPGADPGSAFGAYQALTTTSPTRRGATRTHALIASTWARTEPESSAPRSLLPSAFLRPSPARGLPAKAPFPKPPSFGGFEKGGYSNELQRLYLLRELRGARVCA
jgi:Domain of unknown function (DUF932)